MEIFYYLLPVVFVTGSLQHHRTSSSTNPSGSSWEYKEAVNSRICFLDSTENNKKYLMEKCFADLVDWASSLEFQLLHDRDLYDRADGSLLRIKRNNYTENKFEVSQPVSPLSDIKAILNPVLFPMILILGLILNGTLLFIYWKHDELRTQRNAVFMNLAVSDTLFLLVFGAFQITSRMKHLEILSLPPLLCRIQIFCICVSASIGAYSITLISMQRYLRVVKFKKPLIKRSVKILLTPACLITTLWTLSIVFAIPEVTRSRIRDQVFTCKDPNIFVHGAYPLVLYGILPGTIAAFFYWTVQRRPLKERLGPGFPQRDRPGRVLLSLGVVYLLTYAPVLVCDILIYGEMEIFCYISKLLHMLNPILCPIALCFASGRLRKYFIQHLLCLCITEPRNSASRVTSLAAPSPDYRSGAFEMTVFKETQEATEIPIPAN